MAIQTLTGGQFYSGSATSNAQFDTVEVNNFGNVIWEQFGNLTVSSGASPATDGFTTVRLGGTGVTDNITLAGGGNWLYDFGATSLSGATVNYTASSSTGFNIVGDGGGAAFTNTKGNTTLNLGGTNNQVYLNGNATNSVTLGGSNSIVFIGSYADDDLFGYSTGISFKGGSQYVVGGDETFTITDTSSTPAGSDGIFLGDGNDAITLTGNGNEIVVAGGNDTIDAGGGGAAVYIQGLDHAFVQPPAPDPEDPGVPVSPTDTVTIRGSGDAVSATYENVVILGALVTSTANIQLGNGNNNITLGGSGGNQVSVGNGANTITATGDGSTYNLGNGINNVTLSGNGNLVVVTDPTGVGSDVIQLGAGTGDQIFLGEATGGVADSGTGTTHVTQVGPNAVTVNLGSGTGIVQLGDGGDVVTANGAGSVIVAGDGADTVTANGAGDVVHLGNGADKVTANGASDIIVLGNGANTVMATGTGDYVVLGNGNNQLTIGNGTGAILGNGTNSVTAGNSDVVIFGSGSNTVTAGTGGVLSFHAGASSVNNAQVGGGETVYQQNGVLHVTEPLSNTGGDIFNLNNLAPGSSLAILGNNEQLNFATNSTAAVTLNPSVTGDTLSVFGDGTGAYGGSLTISGFGLNQTMDLQGLIGAVDNNPIGSFAEVLANLNPSTPYNSIELKGGGSINFVNPTALSHTEFAYSGTGSVPLPV